MQQEQSSIPANGADNGDADDDLEPRAQSLLPLREVQYASPHRRATRHRQPRTPPSATVTTTSLGSIHRQLNDEGLAQYRSMISSKDLKASTATSGTLSLITGMLLQSLPVRKYISVVRLLKNNRTDASPRILLLLGVGLMSLLLMAVAFSRNENSPSRFEIKPQLVGIIMTTTISEEKQTSTETWINNVIRLDPKTHQIITRHLADDYAQYQYHYYSATRRLMVEDLGEGKYARNHIEYDSDDYDIHRARRPLDSSCKLSYEWQNYSFPTCNLLHQIDIANQLKKQDKFFLGKGSYRTVFLLEDNEKPKRSTLNSHSHQQQIKQQQGVLKVMNIQQDWDEDGLERHRRDALISERLTSSPRVMNVYSYCGNSAVYEYASGGSLYDAIGAVEWTDERFDDSQRKQNGLGEHSTWTSARKLELAYQAVAALADLHQMSVTTTTSSNDRPLVSHGDVDITQFVSSDRGKSYKINDFNAAQWIYYSSATQKVCPFLPTMGGGKTRSPEEYNGSKVTEKVDIYGVGNVIYTILTGKYPFYSVSSSKATALVQQGHKPEMPVSYQRSDDPNIQALLQAMELCFVTDPKRRASARRVEEYLRPFVERTHQ